MSGWDENGRWKWGRNGHRLDDGERESRHRSRVAAANRQAIRSAGDVARAEALYRGGHLSPWRITAALDAKGLWGPEVDIACGAAEPDVDLWEAGVLYPTWEQVQALAKLCGCTARFLMDDARDGSKIRWAQTSLRFHQAVAEPDLVEKFTPEAIRARLRPRPDEPEPEVTARYQPGDQVALFDPEGAK